MAAAFPALKRDVLFTDQKSIQYPLPPHHGSHEDMAWKGQERVCSGKELPRQEEEEEKYGAGMAWLEA